MNRFHRNPRALLIPIFIYHYVVCVNICFIDFRKRPVLNNQIFSHMRQLEARASHNKRKVPDSGVKESDAKFRWLAGLSKAIWHFETTSKKALFLIMSSGVFLIGF